jgi:phosphatidylglycerol:prolipoprotein diacylglycerol transferase
MGEGGMSIYGGILGLAVATTVFAIRSGVGRLYLYDLVAVTGPIAIFFSRIANFLSGEFIGRPVGDQQIPFVVKYPTEILDWPSIAAKRLPELAPLADKVGVGREKWDVLVAQFPTNADSQSALNAALAKIVEAVQSGNDEIRNLLEPLLVWRHPAQLYAAAGEGIFLFLFLFFLWRKPRRPGVVSASFLVLYSIIRFLDENYRMPDSHLGLGLMDLTRGQWLSIVCFFVGLILLFVWGRRETLPSVGWGRGHSVKLHRR